MRLFLKPLPLGLVALLVFVLGNRALKAEDGGSWVEGMRIPLEHYDDGTIKIQISAGKARIQLDGGFEAKEVKVEFFTPEGELENVVETHACKYDRKQGQIKSGSHVTFTRAGLIVSGTGFEWKMGEEYIKITSDAKVVIERGMIDQNKFL